MFILGLTGSIGMGKTWGAKCFRYFGVPVHDADVCVHRLMGPGGAATDQVEASFPGVIDKGGGVDRQKLADQVLGDDRGLNRLEAILHPLVRQDQRRFLQNRQGRGARLVVLDIPLLYEINSRPRVDAVVVMSAPERVQRQRVMRRVGMTEKKLQTILDRQVPDEIKCRLAEFVVTTGAARGQSLRQIAKVVKVCRSQKGHAWTPGWGR